MRSKLSRRAGRSRRPPGWDAVADGAVIQEKGVALVRDGDVFVAVEPSAVPAAQRGVTIHVVVTKPDGARLELLDATTRGHLPARVHAVLPWTQAATADRELAKVGIRCRYVLHP